MASLTRSSNPPGTSWQLPEGWGDTPMMDARAGVWEAVPGASSTLCCTLSMDYLSTAPHSSGWHPRELTLPHAEVRAIGGAG